MLIKREERLPNPCDGQQRLDEKKDDGGGDVGRIARKRDRMRHGKEAGTPANKTNRQRNQKAS